MEQINECWKIGKQHAELIAANDALAKIVFFALNGTISDDEIKHLQASREIIERGIDRLAGRIESIAQTFEK